MYTKGLVLRIEVPIQPILHPVTFSTSIKSAIIPNANTHIHAKMIYIIVNSRIKAHVDYQPECTWFKINDSYM